MKLPAAARNAIRKAITNHANWDDVRRASGLSLASMTSDDYFRVAEQLKIDINDESIKNMKINGTIEYESINEVIDLLSIAGRINYTFDKDSRHLVLKAK